ncbi:MAG: hypothetical protein KGI04_04495 [Candidatus Micrarchaeota archaeon]|nr:hypothetical protein [Candidatus Micrarchaeota archaeon]
MDLLEELETPRAKHWSRQAIRAEAGEIRREEQKQASEYKVIQPHVMYFVQETLREGTGDETLALRGYAGLLARMASNLQARGETPKSISKLVRPMRDLDFLSSKGLTKGRLEENAAVSGVNLLASVHLLQLDVGGVPVQIGDKKYYSRYMVPMSIVTGEATEVRLGRLAKGKKLRVVSTEDIVLGKLSTSSLEDGKTLFKHGCNIVQPPVHVKDLVTLAYSEKKTMYEFIASKRYGFEQRARACHRIAERKIESVWEDTLKASKRLIGWESGIQSRVLKSISRDDSMPAELRRSVDMELDQRPKAARTIK